MCHGSSSRSLPVQTGYAWVVLAFPLTRPTAGRPSDYTPHRPYIVGTVRAESAAEALADAPRVYPGFTGHLVVSELSWREMSASERRNTGQPLPPPAPQKAKRVQPKPRTKAEFCITGCGAALPTDVTRPFPSRYCRRCRPTDRNALAVWRRTYERR